MDFVSGLALVLLTLVGYSLGAVIGAKDKIPVPRLLDLVVVVVLWIVALLSRPVFGKWAAIGVWLLVGGAVSVVLSSVRRSTMAARETATTAAGRMPGLLKRLWNGWKDLAARMGNYQGRVLLAFFYFVVVTPFGVLVRVFSDPLRTRSLTTSSFWEKRSAASGELEEARRQF
jgi:hypothetical protein